MNRLVVLIILLGVAQINLAQNRRFLAKVKTIVTQKYDEDISPSEAEVDVINFDRGLYASLIFSKVNMLRNKKGRQELGQNSLLNRISSAGIEEFSKSRFTSRKYWMKEKKSINMALIQNRSNYKLFSAYAFIIDLADLNPRASFFYDRKKDFGGTALFKGKRPTTKESHKEGFKEPEEVEMLSEVEFSEEIIKLLNKKGASSVLYSKKFSQIGISIRIDERTLHRNKRPCAYVMIVFGGKKMQKVKELPEYYSIESEADYFND